MFLHAWHAHGTSTDLHRNLPRLDCNPPCNPPCSKLYLISYTVLSLAGLVLHTMCLAATALQRRISYARMCAYMLNAPARNHGGAAFASTLSFGGWCKCMQLCCPLNTANMAIQAGLPMAAFLIPLHLRRVRSIEGQLSPVCTAVLDCSLGTNHICCISSDAAIFVTVQLLNRQIRPSLHLWHAFDVHSLLITASCQTCP